MIMPKKSQPPKLLLVDDEQTNLHALKQILQNNYQLLFAKDGRKAVELCKAEMPDLILLDIMLPEMNGYEVCRAIKLDAHTARIPVIFVSAMSDTIDEAYGFEVGGVDYITKPVNSAIVRARIATHLSLVKIEELQKTERELEKSYAALRKLIARREEMRESERKRIAQDLHDELGQKLSGLRMEISLLRMSHGTNNPALTAEVNCIKKHIDETIQVVRDVAAQLRPAVLDMGITSALEWQAENFSKLSKIPCTLTLDPKQIDMSEEQAIAVFRIVQESFTNIMRYAHPSHVDVGLWCKNDGYLLEISDNGSGFDPAALQKDTFGLLGMRERALVLGATFNLSSTPGKGTKISLHIPFNLLREKK